jgi:hypothetical protein
VRIYIVKKAKTLHRQNKNDPVVFEWLDRNRKHTKIYWKPIKYVSTPYYHTSIMFDAYNWYIQSCSICCSCDTIRFHQTCMEGNSSSHRKRFLLKHKDFLITISCAYSKGGFSDMNHFRKNQDSVTKSQDDSTTRNMRYSFAIVHYRYSIPFRCISCSLQFQCTDQELFRTNGETLFPSLWNIHFSYYSIDDTVSESPRWLHTSHDVKSHIRQPLIDL